MHLLVVAAWDPELERFRDLVAEETTSSAPLRLSTHAVGIGLVDATAGMTRCIAELEPTHVLLIGTCGAAPGSGIAIGDAVVGRDVRLVDPTVVEGRAAMPYAADPVPLDASLSASLVAAGARTVGIVNPLGIT